MSESITVHVKSGQHKWEVRVVPTATIGELKTEISKISEIPSENQRLIFSGKILKDESTVESYKIADGHSIHLVKSAGKKTNTNSATNSATTETIGTDSSNSTGTANGNENVPNSFATGSGSAFNPLADLTGARYAGYGLNLPSADSFGPDGGMNNMMNQEDMLQMMENPIVQSQINEMLSNPQMVDYLIEQNPVFRSMGPSARAMLTSPYMRQMMTNPQMIRQSMQMQNAMGRGNNPNAGNDFGFPSPGTAAATDNGSTTTTTNNNTTNTNTNTSTDNTNNTSNNNTVNPFASMFGNLPPPNPEFIQQMMSEGLNPGSAFGSGSSPSAAAAPADNRPPEEKYEHQLRQLNDMGFFEFDRNVAALRRSGGSVQGALDALLNGSV